MSLLGHDSDVDVIFLRSRPGTYCPGEDAAVLITQHRGEELHGRKDKGRTPVAGVGPSRLTQHNSNNVTSQSAQPRFRNESGNLLIVKLEYKLGNSTSMCRTRVKDRGKGT